MIDGGVEAVKQVAQAVQQMAQHQPTAQAGPSQIVLVLIPLAALALFFLVEFLRGMPWTEKAKQAKPLACDACMVGWASLALGAYLSVVGSVPWALVHVIPSAGLASLLLGVKSYWKGQNLGAPPS